MTFKIWEAELRGRDVLFAGLKRRFRSSKMTTLIFQLHSEVWFTFVDDMKSHCVLICVGDADIYTKDFGQD